MRIKNKFFLSLFMLTACASYPIKDFKSIQYLPQDGVCFERSLDDDTTEVKCYYDEGEPEDKDWTVIKKSDYYKEQDYQALLIKSCQKWK